MEVNRRTQADRSAATREALIAAARPLFAEHGFAGVGTEAIVRAAGVTRGAMYHQFADKTELFAAVVEAVEADLTTKIGATTDASGFTDPTDLMVAGVHAWLDACADPEVQRVILLDAPAVLGWARWREIGMQGIGLIEALLSYGIEVGRIRPQPVLPLAHILIGALDEAALYVTLADDQDLARAEMSDVLVQLVAALATP